MSNGSVAITVAVISAVATLGVALIQMSQTRRVDKNSAKLGEHEDWLAEIVGDLEKKEHRIRRFERFFQDIGLGFVVRRRDFPPEPGDDEQEQEGM